MNTTIKFSKIYGALILTALLLLTSCDFFGKKEEETNDLTPSQFASGVSVEGVFTSFAAFPGNLATDDPLQVAGVTYHFEPNGNSKIEVEDYNAMLTSCTAYGQYRVIGNSDIFIYTQAITGGCSFGSPFHMSQVKRKSQKIEYLQDGSTNTFHLWQARRVNGAAPVGIWNFGGEGGIEYLLFDKHGYFLLQVSNNGTPNLLPGYYWIDGNRLALQFFRNMDPEQIVDDPIVFSRFITDGQYLNLVDTSSSGEVVLKGQRN